MFGQYINLIEKTMDVSALKRKVISNNISNYNTPNFKASKVDFESFFNEQSNVQLKSTSEKHLSFNIGSTEERVTKDNSTKMRHDGNNVDLNREMIEMIKNNSSHSKSVQAINKEFMLLRLAMGK